MPLKLTYTAETNVPVELEDFTPQAVAGKSLDDVRRFEIHHGDCALTVGELFRVAGETDDLEWHLEGELSGVHWVGSHMEQGSIHIHGSAGRHIGSQMRGGNVTVDGDVGDWLGAEMRGGTIHVAGGAGNQVGAAYPGSPRGMNGGTIVVHNDVGDELGHTMRRGLITVGGDCGELAGYAVLAGTILVLGRCGNRPGADMRRGTLGLFGTPRPELLPTFRYACRQRPVVLELLTRQLATLGLPMRPDIAGSDFDIYSGDMFAGGRGEILLPVE